MPNFSLQPELKSAVDLRHVGNVGVGFGGHIQSAAARASDHAQAFGSLA
jgi:hypothetical protein